MTTTKVTTLLAVSAMLDCRAHSSWRRRSGRDLKPRPGATLYEADANSGNILTFTPAGVQSTFASGTLEPFGLAFDAAGNLYVADTGTGDIYKFTPEGVQSTFASGLKSPGGLAFDAAGNLYVGDSSSNVYKFTPSGVRTTFATVPAGGLPLGLAFDAAGNLYVSDSFNSKIFEYSSHWRPNHFCQQRGERPLCLGLRRCRQPLRGRY